MLLLINMGNLLLINAAYLSAQSGGDIDSVQAPSLPDLKAGASASSEVPCFLHAVRLLQEQLESGIPVMNWPAARSVVQNTADPMEYNLLSVITAL